jgi:SAM-dependent methyltransferase
MKRSEQIRNAVREHYGSFAENNSSCCTPGSSQGSCCSEPLDFDEISLKLGYSPNDLKLIPSGSNMGLGCGNPQAIASIREGETVLDLGSGGGFDAFLAAHQTGKTGKVIGVDMTPQMITLSRQNAEKGNFDWVEFRLGEIEYLPVADQTVDVIISNCVINLSPEKQQVFNEAYRVLKKGGRLAVSDVVATAEIPEDVLKDMELYSACVSGASTIDELENMLRTSGFTNIRISPKDESREFIREWSSGANLVDFILSASIEATK